MYFLSYSKLFDEQIYYCPKSSNTKSNINPFIVFFRFFSFCVSFCSFYVFGSLFEDGSIEVSCSLFILSTSSDHWSLMSLSENLNKFSKWFGNLRIAHLRIGGLVVIIITQFFTMSACFRMVATDSRFWNVFSISILISISVHCSTGTQNLLPHFMHTFIHRKI